MDVVHLEAGGSWCCGRVERSSSPAGRGPDSARCPEPLRGTSRYCRLLFVNLNPGWNRDKNSTENATVGASEEASWSFCRALFSRYPIEVGRMSWWDQAIGLGWRIIHGDAPGSLRPPDKRTWANANLAGWELLPLHSQSAGFLSRPNDGVTGCSLTASLGASLRLAMRLRRPVTIGGEGGGGDGRERCFGSTTLTERACSAFSTPRPPPLPSPGHSCREFGGPMSSSSL
jgi:hypothetical protein